MEKRLDERRRNFLNALSRLQEALEKDISDDIIYRWNYSKVWVYVWTKLESYEIIF